MTDFELGWCCGLIDGEGCIGISRPPITQPFVTLTMSHEETVRRFHKLVKVGEVSFRPETKKNWKSCWGWCAYSSHALILIKELEPWLFTKLRQAKLLLEFGERCYRGRNTRPLTTAEQSLRHVLWEEMAELNKKGKS